METDNKFILITSLYNETNEIRKGEYLECLKKNIENPRIKEIHVFYDISKDQGKNEILDLAEKNCNVILTKSRVSYQEVFDYANKMFPNSKIILANGDIYFNKTLEYLDNFSLEGIFSALTRWDVTETGNLKYFEQKFNYEVITRCKICKLERFLFSKDQIEKYDINPPCWEVSGCRATVRDLQILPGKKMDFTGSSQDAWIFETPLKVDFRCYFKLGTIHCDSFLNGHLLESSLNVFNPSKSIQACHLHLSEVRSQDNQELIDKNARRVILEAEKGNKRVCIDPCEMSEVKNHNKEKTRFYVL